MPGRATAVKNGDEFVQAVTKLAGSLGLQVRTQVQVTASARLRVTSTIETQPYYYTDEQVNLSVRLSRVF